MKNFIYIIAILFTLQSCTENNKNNADPHAGHNHETEKKEPVNPDPHAGHNHGGETHGEKESDSPNNHEEDGRIVTLSKEQMELIGLKTELITQKDMSNSKKVTGIISVPPKSKASVYAPMGGFVIKGDFLPGDKIKKGQILAVLEHPKYIDIQQRFLESYAEFQFQMKEWKRAEELNKSDLNSKKNYDTVKRNYKSSEAKYNSLKTQLTIIGLNTKAILNKGIIKQLYVYSPISGFITKNNVHNGKYVEANEELYTIIDTDHLHAELKVYSTDIQNLQPNMPFVFKVAGSNKEYEGQIKLIGAEVHEDDKTIEIHGEIEEEDAFLKPGMFINAEIFPNSSKRKVLPQSAIFSKEGKDFVFIKLNSGEFEKRQIALGLKNDKFVEVISLEKNNLNLPIVTKGVYQLETKLFKQSGQMGHGHAH